MSIQQWWMAAYGVRQEEGESFKDFTDRILTKRLLRHIRDSMMRWSKRTKIRWHSLPCPVYSSFSWCHLVSPMHMQLFSEWWTWCCQVLSGWALSFICMMWTSLEKLSEPGKLVCFFSWFREYRLKYKPWKCMLFKFEVAFLGERMDGTGVHITNDHVHALMEWPEPMQRKQVEQLLWVVIYHHGFFQDLVKITAPSRPHSSWSLEVWKQDGSGEKYQPGNLQSWRKAWSPHQWFCALGLGTCSFGHRCVGFCYQWNSQPDLGGERKAHLIYKQGLQHICMEGVIHSHAIHQIFQTLSVWLGFPDLNWSCKSHQVQAPMWSSSLVVDKIWPYMHFALNTGMVQSISMSSPCHGSHKRTGVTVTLLVTIGDESMASRLGSKRKWMMPCLSQFKTEGQFGRNLDLTYLMTWKLGSLMALRRFLVLYRKISQWFLQSRQLARVLLQIWEVCSPVPWPKTVYHLVMMHLLWFVWFRPELDDESS